MLATALSLGLVVSGCSSSDDDDSTSSETSEDSTRTVTDSEGTEVEVPAHPEKAVALHFGATEPLLDLGVTPVLQGTIDVDAFLPEEEADKMRDVPQLDLTNLNIELIAEEEPDIILAADMVDKGIVDQLRDIAPVYVYTHSKDRGNWEGRSDQIADAMNLSDRLDGLKVDLKDRQEEIAAQYGDALAGFTSAQFASWSDGEFAVVGTESMPGRIFGPTGLQWDAVTTEMTKDLDGAELVQSNEKITTTLQDADVLLYSTDLFGEINEYTSDLMEMSSYKDLPAVKAGKVFPIGKQTIAGYMDAFNALDFLEAALKELEG